LIFFFRREIRFLFPCFEKIEDSPPSFSAWKAVKRETKAKQVKDGGSITRRQLSGKKRGDSVTDEDETGLKKTTEP